MSRRTLAVLILVAWVGALGWLGAREWSLRGKINITGRQVVSPGAAYYKMELHDSQVGYALLQTDTLAPTDTSPALVLVQYRLLLAEGDAPTQRRYELYTSAWLTTDLRLWRSETIRGDTGVRTTWRTRVDHDTLRTVTIVANDTFRTMMPLDTIPVPVEAVPLWIATYGRPRPGRAISLPTIDLADLTRRRVTWTATAESTFVLPDSVILQSPTSYDVLTADTVRAWRVSGTDRSVQVHAWMDFNGFPVVQATGGGLRMVRAPFDAAMAGFKELTDSIKGHSILALAPVADATDLKVRMPEERTLLLNGAEYPPLDAGGPTQRISGDTVTTFEPGSWRGAQALRPLEPLPMQNPRFAPELLPEPRLSWGNPALDLRADSIRNGTTNAREAAIALQEWLHTHMTLRDPVHETGMRPAGLVLASGTGTPEEVAVLTVALARRMGLPARLAGGILLTAHGVRRHSWAELFIGDWVPVDPTQSSLTASPSHIRLIAGGTGAWADLLPLAAAYVGPTAPRELP